MKPDHLSIVAAVGCSMGYLSRTNGPLYKDHLSIMTTVGCSMGYLRDTNGPLYKDHLSANTAITWSFGWSLQASLLCTPHGDHCICIYVHTYVCGDHYVYLYTIYCTYRLLLCVHTYVCGDHYVYLYTVYCMYRLLLYCRDTIEIAVYCT